MASPEQQGPRRGSRADASLSSQLLGNTASLRTPGPLESPNQGQAHYGLCTRAYPQIWRGCRWESANLLQAKDSLMI